MWRVRRSYQTISLLGDAAPNKPISQPRQHLDTPLERAIAVNDWEGVLNYFAAPRRPLEHFHRALFKCRQADRPDYLPRLMRLFKQAGHEPTVVTYTIMLLWRMRWREWEGMVEEMSHPGLVFDDRLKRMYLTALLQKGETRLAMREATRPALDEANCGLLLSQLAQTGEQAAIENGLRLLEREGVSVTGTVLVNLLVAAKDAAACLALLHRYPQVRFSVGCTVRLIRDASSSEPASLVFAYLERAVELGVIEVWRAALSKLPAAELFAWGGHTPASLRALTIMAFPSHPPPLLTPPLVYRRLILEEAHNDGALMQRLWLASMPHTPNLDTLALGRLLRMVADPGEILDKARARYGPLPPSLEKLAMAVQGKPLAAGDDLRSQVLRLLAKRDWEGARALLSEEPSVGSGLRLEVEAAAQCKEAFLECMPAEVRPMAEALLRGECPREPLCLPGELAVPLLKITPAKYLPTALASLQITDLGHAGLRWIIARIPDDGPVLPWLERFSQPFSAHLAEAWLLKALERRDLAAFQRVISRLGEEGLALTAGVHASMIELVRLRGGGLVEVERLWERLEGMIPVAMASWETRLRCALEAAERGEIEWGRIVTLLEAMMGHSEAAAFDPILTETLFDRLLEHCPMAQCQELASRLEQAGVRMGSRWRTLLLEDALAQGPARVDLARRHWGQLVQRQKLPRLDLTLRLFDLCISTGRFTAAHRLYKHLQLHQSRRRFFGPQLDPHQVRSFLALLQHRFPQPASSLLSSPQLIALSPKESIAGILPALLAFSHQHNLPLSTHWCQQALANLCSLGDYAPAQQLQLLMVTRGMSYDGGAMVEQVARIWRNK